MIPKISMPEFVGFIEYLKSYIGYLYVGTDEIKTYYTDQMHPNTPDIVFDKPDGALFLVFNGKHVRIYSVAVARAVIEFLAKNPDTTLTVNDNHLAEVSSAKG